MRKNIMITAPVTSRSGYGAHARDLVKSLIQHDRYNLFIEDVPWGSCPRNALNKNNSEDKKMLDLFLSPKKQLTEQPDIYIDIRIPNEFRQLGKYNIGITAGTETDAVSGKWLECCNKMDLLIVPSNHSMMGFSQVYDAIQQQPNGEQQKIGELKLERPMEVLFEGSDTNIYKPLHHKEIDREFFDWINEKVPEKFAFLAVGQWTKGGFGEDRKDIGTMVQSFYETFGNKKKQPALILKTNGATYSILDKEECLNKLKSIKNQFKGVKLPNVYLFHGEFSDTEMNYLYNHPKVKAMVSFTHGEGFGRPLLEASMTGLPIMAPNWSGQLDFLDTNQCLLIGGEMEKIPESVVWEDILIKDSKWFVVDKKNAFLGYNFIFQNHHDIKQKAESLMKRNRDKFSLEAMTKEFKRIMDNVFHTIEKKEKAAPKTVEVNLPKMKKANIPLPKLNKVENTEVTANE